MVALMKPGSVVVDLAAEQGGNCELTKPGQEVVEHGVTIIGYTDMASRMANVASDLYGTNICSTCSTRWAAPTGFQIDLENDIVRGALVLERGEKRWPPPPPKKVEPEVKTSREGALPAGAEPVTPTAKAAPKGARPRPRARAAVGHRRHGDVGDRAGRGGGVDVPALPRSVGDGRRDTVELLQHLTVFVLAVFVGWQVVWNVTPALHTPLMSVTNAISGIIVVGGLIGGSTGALDSAEVVAIALATLFATINIAGGFLVTRRMLAMFRK